MTGAQVVERLGISQSQPESSRSKKEEKEEKHLVLCPTKTDERSSLETDQEFQLTENIPVDGPLENGLEIWNRYPNNFTNTARFSHLL